MATVHAPARARPRTPLARRLLRRNVCPVCGDTVRNMYCAACGYDLMRQQRDRAHRRPLV